MVSNPTLLFEMDLVRRHCNAACHHQQTRHLQAAADVFPGVSPQAGADAGQAGTQQAAEAQLPPVQVQMSPFTELLWAASWLRSLMWPLPEQLLHPCTSQV